MFLNVCINLLFMCSFLRNDFIIVHHSKLLAVQSEPDQTEFMIMDRGNPFKP